ncbi:acyl-CoA/acyl-ACP dehydrogenase [Rhodococcus rhodochrous]|nr:acyl-CoA dehydrogenase family protein [Rhodococcus rhodochrous]MCB8913528.1 acyl-CoA/acyl-ACP dehydrogenase [Rhodococcus rhodochrous]
MTYVHTEEHDQLRSTVRAFLDQTSPEAEVRRLMDTDEGYDPAVWAQMGEQLALQGLHIPEEFGGSGYGYVELCVVLEELGASLAGGPFFASAVLAASAVMESGDHAARKDLLPSLADGSTIGTVAFADRHGRWDTSSDQTVATRTRDRYLLTGTKSYVLDGSIADVVVVTAELDGELSLFVVSGRADGLTKDRLPTMDLTRKQATLTFNGTPARLLGEPGDATAVLDRVLALACVALANENVGGLRAVLDQSVQYAKERYQFGRPIGSFQAVKHMCADILVDLEGAKSAAYFAAHSTADDQRLPIASSLAKSYTGEAYFRAASANIQIHGGLGFTWEHPAHLYFKRAKSAELLFGDSIYHRSLLAGALQLR